MELDQLKGFYYVARLQSFTAAAAKLYVTQSAISHQIKALEAEVGEPLLNRDGRKIQPTATGSILLESIARLLDQVDALETTVRELKALERGRVRLGASDTACIYYLPELLKQFCASHDGVGVAIKSLLSPLVIRGVDERELDLGIISQCRLPESLEFLPLYKERLVCLVPRAHRLASNAQVTASDLASETLILLEPGSVTRGRIDEFLQGAVLRQGPAIELSNFEIIKRLVAVGLGVSIAPSVVLEHGASELEAVDLDPPVATEGGIVIRRDRKLPRAAAAFLELARAYFGSDRGIGKVDGAPAALLASVNHGPCLREPGAPARRGPAGN